jgi:hypothetical protein
VTKLGPDRGNEVLLQAFALLRRKVPTAKLAIVYKPTRFRRIPKAYQPIPWARVPEQMVPTSPS